MRTWIVLLGALFAAAIFGTWYARRAGRKALLRFRARVDRFKLASRKSVRDRLLADASIGDAVRAYAAANDVSETAAWRRVDQYVHEIVPFFNVVAYYHIGYRVAEKILNLFYKVTVEHEDRGAIGRLPRDSVIVYLMNHRSNADYVLVSYALAGQVAISYAVGEWARAFPLEHIFKAFGSYFVRRRYREPLYHAVLERYVQLITREGVTQGIFLEGGLTRDGMLKPPKIGLLDYVLGIARDPGYRSRIFIVPVAVNYDRVLEDRSLLRELASREGRARPSRAAQLGEVARYVWWNLARLIARRWKRYGRAAVTVGAPIGVAPWLASNPDLFELAKPERLARVQSLCDDVMSRIGLLVPVTPVPLACAAIQSFDRDFIPRDALLERMAEMSDALRELNGRVVRYDEGIAATFDRAWRMLRMRRVLAQSGDGYAVLPRSRELVSYYANSIAHLLGPFEHAVRVRDALPAPSVAGIR
ncbi:MAG TPA: 1-acyl-sn-glycerol-3-phosphate acyltransferase [Gemmatimonadaceae bacterium]|nr:1-acyl-sn-glycerol-3-phosphate acyltransferase [Gemmatimonadaceae bacterium]